MKYVNNNINIEDLIVLYLSYKLKNGYYPFFGEKELSFFLYYMSERKVVNGINDSYQNIINKAIDKHQKKTLDGDAHIILDKKNMVRPTYKFSLIDSFSSVKISQKDEIDVLIKDYLVPYPKRKIILQNNISSENMEIAKIFTILIIKFICEEYTNKYLKLGLWPSHCLDIDKYLLDNDLAKIIEIPSIRKDMMNFYKDFSYKIASMIQVEGNVQISNDSQKLLAYSNYLCCIKGYEKLFNMIDKKYFDVKLSDEQKGSYNYLDNEKIKNLVKKIEKNSY